MISALSIEALLLTLCCFSATLQQPESSSGPETSESCPRVLHVLTYNVFLRAPALVLRDGQDRRSLQMASQLRGYDVILLQEAFSDRYREQLLEGLALDYPFRSAVLGRDRLLRQDGGVVIVSRWPILHQAQRTFGETCSGIDCLASKGVVYARIDKLGSTYHLFAAHTQADKGDSKATVRRDQLRMIRKLVDSQHIPPDEAVIVGGDLNVDLFSDDTDGEYSSMQRILDATHPRPIPGPGYSATWDGAANELVQGQAREYLDYLLYSNRHLVPCDSFNEVRALAVDGRALSDHFAVYGRFDFRAQQPVTPRPLASP